MERTYVIAADWPNGRSYPVCRIEAESPDQAGKLFLAEAVKLHPRWRAQGLIVTAMLPEQLPPAWGEIPASDIDPFPEWVEMEGHGSEWDRRVIVYRSSNLGTFPVQPPLDQAYLYTWTEDWGLKIGGDGGKARRDTRRAWCVDVDSLEDLYPVLFGDDDNGPSWGSVALDTTHIHGKRVPVVHLEDMDWKYEGQQEGIENPCPVWFEIVKSVDLT